MKIKCISISELQKNKILLINKLNIFIFLKLLFLGNKYILVIIDRNNYNYLLYLLNLFKYNIRYFDYDFFNLFDREKVHKSCFELLNYIKNNNLFINNEIIFFFKKLYLSNQVEKIYHKHVIFNCYEYFYLNIYIDFIYIKNKNLIFISDLKYYQSLKIIKSLKNINELNNIKIIHPKIAYFFYTLFYKIISISLFLFLPLILIIKLKLFLKKNFNFKSLIRLYNQGIRLNKNTKRIDWIVDNKNFTNNNIIFFSDSNLDKPFKKDLKKNFYFYKNLSIFKFKYYVTFSSINKNIKLIFKSYRYFCFKIFNYSQNDLKFLLSSLLTYLKWQSFLSKYQIKLLISYQDYSVPSLLRNIILDQNGCKSILYRSTYSEGVFSENIINHRLITHTFLNYSCEYHWGEKSIDFAKKSFGLSHQYKVIKPLWSVRNNTNYKKNNNKNIKNNNYIYLVAFSSSYNFNSINQNTSEDHYLFLKALAKLISEKNIIVYFKPKSSFNNYRKSHYEKLKKLSNELISNKNFKLVDIRQSSINLLNECDISISMSFSTTTLESLCIGKKSFYFDGNSKFCNADYYKIPNFVCSKLEDILNYFNFWYFMNNEDFIKFYDNNFNKEFGNFKFNDNPMTFIKKDLLNIIK